MDRMIYVAMSGAKAMIHKQEVLANNLANLSTPGFRAVLQASRAVPVAGDNATTRAFTAETTPTYSNKEGPLQNTGRKLDVAMKGNAWLTVQGLDGTEAYTRGGSLDRLPDGTLVTRSGLPVMGDGGPIQVPAGAEVTIGQDGTISALVGGAGQVLGRLKLVTPAQPLIRSEDGLFRPDGGEAQLPADPNARLIEGALEGSNVSAIETMIGMIAASRQFEVQMRMLQNAETNDRQAGRLLGPNG